MPKISVVIPVYKDLYGLSKTLKSIEKQSFQDFEIIVINDGADKEIERLCFKKGINFKNIIPNKGSYNARNEGIKLSNSSLIAFTDADLVTTENWLVRGMNKLESYDYVAGSVQVQKELIVDIATFHDYLTAFPVQHYFDHYHFGVTANLFVKKKVFEIVGLFDSELRSGGDLEFGDRVYRAGLSQAFDDRCIVNHPPRAHAEKKMKLKRVREGQFRLSKKYPDRFSFLNKNKSVKQLLIDLMPPNWYAARKVYQEGFPFSIWKFYRYLYKIKFLVFKINYFEKSYFSKF